MQEIQQKVHKVVVVGAGLSGLTAALELLKGKNKVEVVLLEALNRVGGRTYSIGIQGLNYDLGASYIGPTQTHVIELSQLAKNEPIPQYHTGTKILQIAKEVSEYQSDIPNRVNIFALLQMQLVIWKVNRMAKKVPVEAPEECEHAHRWDSMTLQSWINDNLSWKKVRYMFQAAVRVIMGCELSQVSLLYFLWYIHQSQNFDNLINVKNGLQEKKLKLGTQQLSEYLMQEVKQRNGKIYFETKVKEVNQSQGKCVIKTTDNKEFECDYLIFAVPPPCLKKILFLPSLSIKRKFLIEKYFMGNLGKMLILYETAFWKKKGYSGEILSDCFDSPLMNVFDDTKVDSHGVERPGLIVFFGGAVYQEWHDRKDLQSAMLSKLASFFKEPEMLKPTRIQMETWDQISSIGGSPIAVLPPGVLSRLHNLRKPQGRIHWAGTEMATKSIGYMDGAIESGKRCSKEIMHKIDTQQKEVKQGEKEEEKKELLPPFSYTKSISSKWCECFEWW